MADFKEQTNSLMVRVIPIYLAAELLCPNLVQRRGRINVEPEWGGVEGERERERVGCICHVKRREGLLREVYLIAAQLNSKTVGAVYERVLNKRRLCHKAN